MIRTKDLGILFGNYGVLTASVVYVDDFWAGDLENHKPIIGIIAVIHGADVARCTRKQKEVCISSVESEDISMYNRNKATMWPRLLVYGFGVVPASSHTTLMMVDNQAAVSLVNSTVVTSHKKHVDVRLHSTGEIVVEGTLDLLYRPTGEVCDMLTKRCEKLNSKHLLLQMA